MINPKTKDTDRHSRDKTCCRHTGDALYSLIVLKFNSVLQQQVFVQSIRALSQSPMLFHSPNDHFDIIHLTVVALEENAINRQIYIRICFWGRV